MITLYVQEPGTTLRRTHRRLLVERDGTVLRQVRLRDLERVVLVGDQQLTGPAMRALLEAGIETVLLSPGGRLQGRLAPAEAKNIFLRQAQFRRYDDLDCRLRAGRAIIAGKLRNSRLVLRRHRANHPEAELGGAMEVLERCREKLDAQSSMAGLMGIEGEGARAYFGVLGQMVRSEFTFTVRSRRPPGDPINAALSFGYTLVATELAGAAAAQGLDPHVGLLHDLDYGRPSLALDLLEEFRQPLVDRLVLSMANRGVLKPEHFEDRGERGVYLNDAGRPRFLEFYHRALETEFQDRPSGDRVTYRELFRRQARRFRQAVEHDTEYEPFAAS